MTIHDIEEHICCHNRMGTNVVNLGGEKKNMKFGCQTYIHTKEGRQNVYTRTEYF